MMTHLDDPQNHVPEVSSDDAWGDLPASVLNGGSGCYAAPVSLPPRRSRNESPAGREQPVEPAEEGLRIDIKPVSRESGEAPAGIEVQEINGDVVRLDAVIESPSRIPRQVTFRPLAVADESDPARRGEGREWGRASRNSLPWIVGSGIGITGMILFALMMLPSINETNAARPGQIGLVIDPVDLTDEVEMLSELLTRRSDALEVFRSFAVAGSSTEMVPLLREDGSVDAEMLADHAPAVVPADWTPPESSVWSAFEMNGKFYGVLEGTLPDFSAFRAYMVPSGNHLLLDWKASTSYGSSPFDDLAAGLGDASEIRAEIILSGYYTQHFPEADFQSYQLISPDKRQSLWCYTRRSDPAESRLSVIFDEGEILKSERSSSKVTVRLARGPAGSPPNHWVLEELLHQEWINL